MSNNDTTPNHLIVNESVSDLALYYNNNKSALTIYHEKLFDAKSKSEATSESITSEAHCEAYNLS